MRRPDFPEEAAALWCGRRDGTGPPPPASTVLRIALARDGLRPPLTPETSGGPQGQHSGQPTGLPRVRPRRPPARTRPGRWPALHPAPERRDTGTRQPPPDTSGHLFDYLNKQKNYKADRRSAAKLSLNQSRGAPRLPRILGVLQPPLLQDHQGRQVPRLVSLDHSQGPPGIAQSPLNCEDRPLVQITGRPPPADHDARAGPCPQPAPRAASPSCSPRSPPLRPATRTIRSTSKASRRPASTRLTSGNDSHAGAVARACPLKGARQHLQAPLTSDVRPGLRLTQPPDIRDHGQQAVDS